MKKITPAHRAARAIKLQKKGFHVLRNIISSAEDHIDPLHWLHLFHSRRRKIQIWKVEVYKDAASFWLAGRSFHKKKYRPFLWDRINVPPRLISYHKIYTYRSSWFPPVWLKKRFLKMEIDGCFI
jgi:hypothetical protein